MDDDRFRRSDLSDSGRDVFERIAGAVDLNEVGEYVREMIP